MATNPIMANQVLEDCAQFVAQQEKKLPPYHRLHLFYELPETNNQGNSSNSQQESTIQYALHCIHSLYVYFENCPHNGPAKISSGIGLFHTRRSMTQSERTYTPSSSTTRIESADHTEGNTSQPETLQASPSDEEPRRTHNTDNGIEDRKEYIHSQYTEALNRLKSDRNMLPWFPSDFEIPEVVDVDKLSSDHSNTTASSTSDGGPSTSSPLGDNNDGRKRRPKPKEYKKKTNFSQGDVLSVPGAIVDQLSEGKTFDILHIYQTFFISLFNTFKQAEYKSTLVSDRQWRGKLSYNHFTAPWMRRVLSVGTEVIFINPLGIKALPDHRRIRSSAGSRKASFILAAFYDNEPSLRGILTKIVHDKLGVYLGLFMKKTTPPKTVSQNEEQVHRSQRPPAQTKDNPKTSQNNPNASRQHRTLNVHSNNTENSLKSTEPSQPTISQQVGHDGSSNVGTLLSQRIPTKPNRNTASVEGQKYLEPHNIAPTSSTNEARMFSAASSSKQTETGGQLMSNPNISPPNTVNIDTAEGVFNDSSLSAALQQPIPSLPNDSPLPPPDLNMGEDNNSYDPFGRHDDESRDLCIVSTEAIDAATKAIEEEHPSYESPTITALRRENNAGSNRNNTPETERAHRKQLSPESTGADEDNDNVHEGSLKVTSHDASPSSNSSLPSMRNATAMANNSLRTNERRRLRSSSRLHSYDSQDAHSLDAPTPSSVPVQDPSPSTAPSPTTPQDKPDRTRNPTSSTNWTTKSTPATASNAVPTDFSLFNRTLTKKTQKAKEMKRTTLELRKQRYNRLTRALAIKKREEEQKAKDLAEKKRMDQEEKLKKVKVQKRSTSEQRTTKASAQTVATRSTGQTQPGPSTRTSPRNKHTTRTGQPTSVLRTKGRSSDNGTNKKKRKVSFADESLERRRSLRSSTSPPSKKRKVTSNQDK